MMQRTVLMALLATTLAIPVMTSAADGIREGLWEIRSEMDMPGMPVKMPPSVTKHCYSKQDVQDSRNVISRDKNCTVTELKSSGNRVSWKMKCTGENAGTFSGETVFAGDSYTSTMKMQGEGKKKMSMNMKVRGKRLGACP